MTAARLDLLTPPSTPAPVLPPRVGPWGGAAEWDAMLSASPDASIYHRAEWKEIYERVMRFETAYRVARDASGGPVGLLPLVHVRSPLAHYLVSLPFLNVGGPIGSGIARTALAIDAGAMARGSGASMLELRARGPTPCDLDASFRKITVRLALPLDPKDLWEAFPAKLRSQVRRPQRAGLTVHIGTDRWEDFYRVLQQHMHELGTPVLPREWFGALVDAFRDQVEVCVVYHQEVPVAAGFGFQWREEFEIVWASSLYEYNSVSPNMLLYWALMERVSAKGARVFDFGRCTPGGGTHRFKRQWGGVDVPLPWLEWHRRRGKRASVPSGDSAFFKKAASLWRRLPRSMADRFGPVVARWLP